MASDDPAPRKVEDTALIELQKQMFEQVKTSTDLTRQISMQTADTVKMLGKLETLLATPGAAGGGSSPGYFQGRPVMSQNQTRRPTMGPGGYPGGAGYGMHQNRGDFPGEGYGTQGFSRGGVGGMLGMAQAAAARMIHNTVGEGAGGAASYQREADGSITSFDRNGNPVHSINDQTMHSRNQASRMAAHVGNSSSILGALRGIPVAGMAVGAAMSPFEAVQKFGNFIGNQRAANAQYQSIYGPGTSGFDQRMQNFGGRANNMMRNVGSAFGIGSGGLSDSDYDTAFKSISAMGFQGGDRDRMLNFANNNFNSMGMSVNDSLQLMSVSVRQASTDLSGLTDQLKNVSQMAQSAGQSAEVFRQKFSQSYQTAVQNGYGASSAAIATSQVGATVAQGRMFSGLNTSQMYSTMGGQQMLASRMGYSSVLDFSLASQANPTVMANAQDKQLDSVMNSVVPADVRALVQQEIAKQPGGAQSVANDSQRATIVVQSVEQQKPGALNVWAIRQALSAANIGIDQTLMNNPDGPAIYYVQWVAKNGSSFSQTTAQTMKSNDQRSSSLGSMLNSALHGGQPSAYSVGANGKVTYDPLINKLQRDGVSQVQVETGNGPMVVSTDYATQHYRDQLTKGTAIIESGPNAGAAINQYYTPEQSAKNKSTTNSKAGSDLFDTKTSKALAGMNLTDDEMTLLTSLYGKKGGFFGGSGMFSGSSDKSIVGVAKALQEANAASGGTGGSIMVGLQPGVAQYLQVQTTGNNLTNIAADSGAPPAISSGGSSTSSRKPK